MTIRHFQPGDEQVQVAIYNAAAGTLPKFKPATLPEVQRRTRARDFDPATRLYAEEGGNVVGYCTIQSNGRVSYPWCLQGQERHAEPLFDAALAGLKARGVGRAFAAYRKDWAAINQFFLDRGFALAREMVNFLIDGNNLPTVAAPSSQITPLRPEDVPAVFALLPAALRVTTPEALHDHLFKNPYFTSDSLFVARSRQDSTPMATGILITEPAYADPLALDADMPCFRLGAFGTEGMTTKRVRGLFSFLAKPERSLFGLGMDLLGHAAYRLSDDDDIANFAAQAPSDVPALITFYQQHFRRQGSFPVFERALG